MKNVKMFSSLTQIIDTLLQNRSSCFSANNFPNLCLFAAISVSHEFTQEELKDGKFLHVSHYLSRAADMKQICFLLASESRPPDGPDLCELRLLTLSFHLQQVNV